MPGSGGGRRSTGSAPRASSPSPCCCASGNRAGPVDPPSTATSLALGPSLKRLFARPSYAANTLSQTIYTFVMGGLAWWMPTYFHRNRDMELADASTIFGGLLLLAGLLGTPIGAWLGDRMAANGPTAT